VPLNTGDMRRLVRYYNAQDNSMGLVRSGKNLADFNKSAVSGIFLPRSKQSPCNRENGYRLQVTGFEQSRSNR